MDATSGLTKKTPGPGAIMTGLTLSAAAARRGLGRGRDIDAWTRYQDPIALGDAAVSAKVRFLSTPLPVPTLSANGAKAGLGPDRTGPDSSSGADVATRPNPILSKAVASRVGDDIGEAGQLAHARAMGVQTPPEAPRLSPNGARAGLGPFVTGSPGDKARADAMAKMLAQSIAQVRRNARALLTSASTGVSPVLPLSDGSARAGLTGSRPTPAAEKGFAMRVPKSPIAQDRERWASGTSARIAAASKGLGLAKTDWVDHRGALNPKPQPKRTWVGVQGDATENPYDMGACSDPKQSSYAAVNKAAPLRELEKERVPSDVCPPLRPSGMLEVMLRGDAHLAATAPDELVRTWAARPSPLRGGKGSSVRSVSLKPPPAAMKGLGTGADCGCDDCGCNGVSKKENRGRAMNGRASIMQAQNGARMTAGSGASGQEFGALVESFAVRHGKDATAEWFVPVFMREGRLVLGTEQRGPSSHAWHPDTKLEMKPRDSLVATIHTHSRSPEFSEDDRNAGNVLGVPMVLIAPGAERARLYDPSSRSTVELPELFSRASRTTWKIPTTTEQGGTRRSRRATRQPRVRSIAPNKRQTPSASSRITISAPQPNLPSDTYGGRYPNLPMPSDTNVGALLVSRYLNVPSLARPQEGSLPAPVIDSRILVKAVQLAVANRHDSTVTPELIWMTIGADAATWKPPPKIIPDADLFRAIVAVAKRTGEGAVPSEVLEQAKKEPLYVEPALLQLIVKYARQRPLLSLHDVWSSAWADRTQGTELAGIPTPPDGYLLRNLFLAAGTISDPDLVLAAAHLVYWSDVLSGKVPPFSDVWPRHVATDLLNWIIFFTVASSTACGASLCFSSVSPAQIAQAALYGVNLSHGRLPPEPMPNMDLVYWITQAALAFPSDAPLSIRNRALANQLSDLLFLPDHSGPGSLGTDLGTGPFIWNPLLKIPPPPPQAPTCTVVSSSVVPLKVLGVDLPGTQGDCVTILNDFSTTQASNLVTAILTAVGAGEYLKLIAGTVVQAVLDLTGTTLVFHFEKVTRKCSDGTSPTDFELVWGCAFSSTCGEAGTTCLQGPDPGCCEGLLCGSIPTNNDPTLDQNPPGVCFKPMDCSKERGPCYDDAECCSGNCDAGLGYCIGDAPPPLTPACNSYYGDQCNTTADCCGGNTCQVQLIGQPGTCIGGATRPSPPQA